MIASLKMQKATKRIISARSYIQHSWHILRRTVNLTQEENNYLLAPKKLNHTAIILITGDRGLCGSYNNEIIKKLFVFIQKEPNRKYDVFALGKAGAKAVAKSNLANLVAEYPGPENLHESHDINPIFKTVFAKFNHQYDAVVIIYSHFASKVKYLPVVSQILPISPKHLDEENLWEKIEINTKDVVKFEPKPAEVLKNILKQILKTQIYGAALEANASEQSARMLAMKNATDSAEELIEELTLTYNSIRQSTITAEISEISAAAEAMK